MLVCHCHRVSDAQIDQVLDAGAPGLRGVVRATHAGTGCGGCLSQLRALCDSAARERVEATSDAIAG